MFVYDKRVITMSESYDGIFFNGRKLDDKYVSGMGLGSMPYLEFYLKTAKALTDEVQKVLPDANFRVDYDRTDAVIVFADSEGKAVTGKSVVSGGMLKSLETLGFRSERKKDGFGFVNLSDKLTVTVDAEAMSKDKNMQDMFLSNIRDNFVNSMTKSPKDVENDAFYFDANLKLAEALSGEVGKIYPDCRFKVIGDEKSARLVLVDSKDKEVTDVRTVDDIYRALEKVGFRSLDNDKGVGSVFKHRSGHLFMDVSEVAEDNDKMTKMLDNIQSNLGRELKSAVVEGAKEKQSNKFGKEDKTFNNFGNTASFNPFWKNDASRH